MLHENKCEARLKVFSVRMAFQKVIIFNTFKYLQLVSKKGIQVNLTAFQLSPQNQKFEFLGVRFFPV